jgi:LuxR family maltose regulon positive regulatory protein
MVTPILTTKLHIPSLRRNLVPRQQLLERLDQGLHHKLTIVSAPAGFGKTTLLGAWIHSLEASGSPAVKVGWISLDEGDNDPARFSAYLVAALQGIEVSIGQVGGDALESAGAYLQESHLVKLINQVAVLPQALVLVLDDYHLITSQVIHKAVTFLIDHLSENLHLVLATRADPPLRLPRLRARGHLTELRQSDLRFTTEEAAAFLNNVMGLDLSAKDVAALEGRTEGWIAGLQMAALSMRTRVQTRGRQDLSEFVESFTGSHRFILEYLVEEVLEQQTPAARAFLLKTSILDRLTGTLCDALLQDTTDERNGTEAVPLSPTPGASSSQRLLEQLDAANLFILSLDEERVWYRYHRLFSDLLRRRLAQALPDQVPVLHRRASHWYQEAGMVEKAIDHALAAGDVDRATSLIEAEAEATLKRSEVTTFLDWMEQLPVEEIRARPALVLLHAAALLTGGRSLDTVAVRIRDVEEYRDLKPGSVSALLGYYEILRGQVPLAAVHAAHALRDLPEDDLLWRNLATLSLSTCQLAAGDLEASSQTLDELARVGRETGNVLMAVGGLVYLALFSIRRTQLHEAKTIYVRALELASDGQAGYLPIAGQALVGLGNLAREWNDLDAARRYLQEGIKLARDWSAWSVVEGLIALAHVTQAQGDVDSASNAIQEAGRLAAQSDSTDLDDLYVGMHQARLWVTQANLEAATRWAEQRGLGCRSSPARPGRLEIAPRRADSMGQGLLQSRIVKYERLVFARLLLKLGQPGELLGVLDPLLAEMDQQLRPDLALQCQVLRALALQAQGKTAPAMIALEHALSLGMPGGYVRLFVDEGEPMTRLLREAASRGVAPEYVESLLATFGTAVLSTEEETPPGARLQPLMEPLSERELEVLRLLAAGLSNPEIASELVIAVSTVRSHLKNIYGKLDVHKRWGAVRRAEELGLL